MLLYVVGAVMVLVGMTTDWPPSWWQAGLTLMGIQVVCDALLTWAVLRNTGERPIEIAGVVLADHFLSPPATWVLRRWARTAGTKGY